MDDRARLRPHLCPADGMGASQASDAAETALARVGMTEHMNRAIRGYSKGMRQRTKLAQALVHEPRVLFLDEPLTGTDPVARRDLMDVIRELADGGAACWSPATCCTRSSR